MKKSFLIVILVFSLLLSGLLTACGEDKNAGGSTPDTASSAAAAVSSPTAAASKSASSTAASSKAQTSSAKDTPSGAPAYEAEPQGDAPQETPQQADSKAQPKSPSGDTSSTGNPAYRDGAKPIYTIALTNTADKSKSYSAACNYATDKQDVAYVSFFLPGGTYDIAVYEYADDGKRGDPIATGAYQNPIKEDERKSIHVNYYPDSGKIEVEEVKSKRNQ